MSDYLIPLVNPEPRSVHGMERITALLRRLEALPLQKLRALGHALVLKHYANFPRVKQKVERDLREAEEDSDLPRLLILEGLIMEGELTAYAYHPPSENCFGVERVVWHSVLRLDQALGAIENGRAPQVLKDRYPAQSIEYELGDRPLFVLKSQTKSFLRVRPPSEANVRRAARAIVREHKKSSRQPMIRRDFVAALVESCPGCSQHHARTRAWPAHVPKAWRKGGRRRART